MLVTCPECNAKISNEADPCPKCGCPEADARSQEAKEALKQQYAEALQKHKESVVQWNKHIQVGDQKEIYKNIGYEYCPYCGKRFSCAVVSAVLHKKLCCLRIHCHKCDMKRLLYPPDFSSYSNDVYQ